MTQINLLPWREQARQEKKIDFFITLGIFISLTILLIILIHIILNGRISNADARVAFLQSTLGTKQGEFNTLKTQKNKQDTIENDLIFFAKLRTKSFDAVRILSELTKVVPNNITLVKIIRIKNKIILIGKSQSDLQITDFMKNIRTSNVFSQPILTRINQSSDKTQVNTFELQVELPPKVEK